MLDLQQTYGNQAVAQLLAAGGHGSPPPVLPNGHAIGNRAVAALVAQRALPQRGVVQRLPADTNTGERVQHLRAAIEFVMFQYRFIIDEGKASDALENMTADEGKQVKARYQELEKRNLAWIFSAVETPIEDGPPASNNLSMASRTKLLNLLAGTRLPAPPPVEEPGPIQGPAEAAPVEGPAAAGPTAAGPAAAPGPQARAGKPAAAPPSRPDAAKVRNRQQRALAASIKVAIEKKDAEAAIALIPASMDERREIDALYKSMYGRTAYMDLFTKLPGKDGARAGALWYDEKDEADRYAVEAGVEARNKAEKEAKALESSAFGSMLGDAAKAKRQEGDKKLEAAVRKVANTGDQTTLAGKQASRERLREIVHSVERGDKSALGPKNVGLNDDPILKAIAEGNEADEIGARLARADAINDVAPAEIEGALRELRTLAEDEAQRTVDDAKEGDTVDAAATTKAIVDGYFARFKSAFNRAQKRRTFLVMMAGRGGTDEKVANVIGVDVDTLHDVAGGRAEIDRNLALMGNKGQLDELSELVFALASKPKDIERARGILGSKTYTEVDKLGKQYHVRTKHTLEQDLAGTEAEQAYMKFSNEGREDVLDKRDMLVGGQWDRELAEKYAPSTEDSVTREAYLLKAEGDFWFRKAGRLEDRVIANRGLFARARDWSGNDEKEILDTAGADRWKAIGALGKALAPGKAQGPAAPDDPGGSGPDLAAARKAVEELRIISRRMTHATTIYKESTKKAYEEFVDLVVNAASIAAGLGVTGIWLTALRATAATVGTKLVMKGSDYSVDEFIGDLQGGLAGVAGDFAKLGMNKVLTPYVASKIMRLATKLGMSKEFKAQVAAKLGPLALRQAEHTVGTAVQNVSQGKSWKEGQGWVDRAKGELQNVVTAPIDQGMRTRKAAAAAKLSGATGGEEEAAPARTSDQDEATSTRPATGEPMTPSRAGPASEVGDGATTTISGPAAESAEDAVPATPMALPEPASPTAPRRKPAQPPPIPAAAKSPRPTVSDPAPDSAADPAEAKGEASPRKPTETSSEDRPTPRPTGAAGPTGGGPSVEQRARDWQPPDHTGYMPAMSVDGRGREVVLPNVLMHPDIESQVPIPALLAELDRTPWGERIADRIRSGKLQLVILPFGHDFPFGGLYNVRGKTYIAWNGDLTETASNALHEGSHDLDPTTPDAGKPRKESRLGNEAEARTWEYEYNELAGRPPRQPSETAYRAEFARIVRKTAGTFPKDKHNPHGADLRTARIEADKAMLDAMRGDPGRYAVESIPDEDVRLASRRDPDFVSMQIDKLLPELPPVPDVLEIESMFGGDEQQPGAESGQGVRARPPDPAEWQDAGPGQRPDRGPRNRPADPDAAESSDPDTMPSGPRPTEAAYPAPYQAPPDPGLAGDRKNPARRAVVLPEEMYDAADRPISKREEGEIARSQENVRRAIRLKLTRLPNGIDSGHDFEQFTAAIKALQADPDLGTNREILLYAEDIWKAIHDPALIADVVSQIYGEARRRPGSGALDPLTKAILRKAGAQGPVHVIPPKVDLGDNNFFEHWIATGRQFLDLDIDTAKHGHTTHLLQSLIVDAALKRAGLKMTASRFRQLLGGAQSTQKDMDDPGNTLWIKMFDGIDGIPTPEIFLPALRTIPGLEKLR